MTKLSAIVITKNEEKHIAECLRTIGFADEIIVMDSGSEDETEAIARSFTPHVYSTEWKGYAGTKLAALDRCKGEWVFWIDADERVTDDLKEEIGRAISEPTDCIAFRMPRKAYFLGRWIAHSGWYPGYVVRLFRKDHVSFGDERVHEKLHVHGRVGTFRYPLLHFTDDSIEHYFDKFNVYTTLAALDLKDRGRRFHLIDLFGHSLNTFFRMYIWRRGFLDGVQGFILAVFSACYVFTKYAKLWELNLESNASWQMSGKPPFTTPKSKPGRKKKDPEKE